MTTQIPDTCSFDGRKWTIESWDGSTKCVPTNSQLGFTTMSPSTANWSGRIDHFLVHKGVLYLFKVEVTLPDGDKGLLPFGSRREIVLRYDQMMSTSDQGMQMRQCEHRYEYLVFDDLIVPFTGKLQVSYPYFDPWELPWPLAEDELDVTETMVLHFRQGVLLEI